MSPGICSALGLASNRPLPDQRDRLSDVDEHGGPLPDTRRATPQNGLVDDLIAVQSAGHQVDGRPMSDWDLVGYFAMMLAAGVDTTAASLGNAPCHEVDIPFTVATECRSLLRGNVARRVGIASGRKT